jgi:hypothetical protein
MHRSSWRKSLVTMFSPRASLMLASVIEDDPTLQVVVPYPSAVFTSWFDNYTSLATFSLSPSGDKIINHPPIISYNPNHAYIDRWYDVKVFSDLNVSI